LANLRRLPIDDLKIDRSFVSPMLRDESDLIIVRSTINLGHDLGLRIIAEGVEDGATLRQLALLGCDLAQGFHVSRPMAADAFDKWLRAATPDEEPVNGNGNGNGSHTANVNGRQLTESGHGVAAISGAAAAAEKPVAPV
jgi:predicted signal transduction protein with EAL and GGDEF domain